MAKKAKQGKKRTLTQEHKDKIGASQSKRYGKTAKSAPKKARKKRVSRTGRAPAGVHVLRRNGNGKDLLEGNAVEILDALRITRKLKELIGST